MSIMSDDDFVRLFQRTLGLDEDGWAGRDVESKLRELATQRRPPSQCPRSRSPRPSQKQDRRRPSASHGGLKETPGRLASLSPEKRVRS